MTETYFGSSTNQIAHAVSLDNNHANAFVAAGAETCWSRFDHCGGEMHDVFIVISEGSDGEHVARTVYAADEDDARQTHRENYPDETLVAVRQRNHRAMSRPAVCDVTPSRSGVWAGKRLDGHMARFAFEALGN